MKILLINNLYPTDENPQPAAYIKTQKDCLEAAGAEVDLLVLKANFTGFVSKYFNYLKFFAQLIFNFSYGKYNLIYLNHLPNYFFALFVHFPFMKNVVIHWHGSEIYAPNTHNHWLNKISYLFTPKRFYHIAPSHYFASEVAQVMKIKPEQVFISPSGGVDMDKFKPSEYKSKTDEIVIGFASELSFMKGADTLLKLLERKDELEKFSKRKLHFKAIAYGRNKNYFLEKFKAQENKIEILNPIPNGEMESFFNSLDILFFPTRRRAESLGLVALEAMACGKPVLGPKAFALPEYIKPGINGEFYENDIIDEVERVLIRMIQNITNYKTREFVTEKYSNKAVIEGYKVFLKQF
ncbi:MAG: D-inositol-3-phosphate glycosyltransferase [Bacteroidia bacterium]|nr:D-inositol-3-phosphate glycosyltransferase [Bacteroidia bacterium]